MRTDQLIDFLGTNLEPVKPTRFGKTLMAAIAVGGAAAFCVMLATVGLRGDIGSASGYGFLALKLVFTLSVIAVGSVLLVKLMRPGQNLGKLFVVLSVPFLASGLAGVVGLSRSTSWSVTILGTDWITCMYCIPLFAVLPYAVLIWALREGAPTNLRLTGGIAGLVAGALGATAYAFHCSDDTLPFIAVWYGGLIAFCAVVGAWLGPRFLRW